MEASRVRDAAGVLRAARELSGTLFAAALETDAAPLLPAANLDLLAAAGLYGVAADLDAVGVAEVAEALAAGCLTTTFVWIQHHTAVRALTASANAALRSAYLPRLLAGEVRSGIALGGLFGADPLLHARAVTGGWTLDGTSPWVTGWGRVDTLCVAARAGDDVVWALVDAVPADSLAAHAAPLVAVNASGTVTLRLSGHRVPADRILEIAPYDQVRARDSLWANGALSLGVAARCCALLGASRLDAELDAVRAALHAGLRDPAAGDAAATRAAAAELAHRAAAALVTATGSRALRLDEHAQRLARESLFLLVFGTRPAMRTALLERLRAE